MHLLDSCVAMALPPGGSRLQDLESFAEDALGLAWARAAARGERAVSGVDVEFILTPPDVFH